MFQWLFGGRKSVDGILANFHKKMDAPYDIAERLREEAADKEAKASRLRIEAGDALIARSRAISAAQKIGNIMDVE